MINRDALDEAAARAIVRERLKQQYAERLMDRGLPPGACVWEIEAEVERYWRDHLAVARGVRRAVMRKLLEQLSLEADRP